jgi:Prokaryotic E2 family E
MCPKLVEEEVKVLRGRAFDLELTDMGGQCYALAHALDAQIPPWDKSHYDVLIAIPAAFGTAALDGFYLSLPYKFNGGVHPRVENGEIIRVQDREWRKVSWHYVDGKVWQPGQDNLESHLVHCKGFFLNRGAINAY